MKTLEQFKKDLADAIRKDQAVMDNKAIATKVILEEYDSELNTKEFQTYLDKLSNGMVFVGLIAARHNISPLDGEATMLAILEDSIEIYAPMKIFYPKTFVENMIHEKENPSKPKGGELLH